MDTLVQFTTNTHTRGENMKNVTLGLKSALDIAQAVDWHEMARLADQAREYLPAVQDELLTLKQAHASHPERMARRAILFGIATPNRDEVASIGWARMADQWFGFQSPRALARRRYESLVTGNMVSIGFYESLTTCLAQLERWESFTDATLAELEALPGVGPKVARMIQAVLEPGATNWTVVLWHMRQLLWAADREYRVRVSCSAPAYKVLEAVWLEYAERFFPGVDTFAVQWTTWCVADGRFNSHAKLWEDLAA
jgi:hypothetical protein